jgi:hypothetical protein
MIVATFDGQQADRAAVQAWENNRAQIVMQKMGLPDQGLTLPQRRAALLAHKLAMGHAAIRSYLSLQLFASGLLTLILSLISGKKRAFCVVELAVSEGSAEQFKTWFENRVPLDDQASMLNGNPDHYIIDTSSAGHQVVVETLGGAPFASEIVISYGDTSGLVTPADPAFPLQIFGTAYNAGGRAVGGVRHQLRQDGAGFVALITAELPAATFGSIVKGNCWHLACEFSNWIEMAEEAA